MIRLHSLFISASLWIAFANQAHAFYITEENRCSTVDLRTDFPMKMRNQGDISWCYAHATADYLQFFNRIPAQISAADIATLYNQRRWPRLVRWLIGGVVPETGFARGAMADIVETGYCPEDYFPSESWTKRILNGPFAGQLIQVPIKKAIEELFQLADGVSSGIYRKFSDLPYSFEFKGLTAESVAQAVMTNPADVLNEVRSAACDSHRMPFPKFPTDIRMEWKGKNTFTEINRILDRRQPVSVDYFYGFLQNIDDYQYSVSDLHTTLLMGRKFDPISGECRYLIKNSYGTACDEYDRRHQCEAGYVWVSELSLYGAMTSYVHIARSQDQFTGTAEQIQDEPARR